MKVAYLAGMNVSASGLAAQREVMNATAENLANAQTTRTETGEPYRRKVVTLAATPFQAEVTTQEQSVSGAPKGTKSAELARTSGGHLEPLPRVGDEQVALSGVSAEVEEDQSEFPTVYDPGHPDADAEGMVKMPNVDLAQEMVSMLSASRAYEANVAALAAAKRVAEAGLNLAR